MPLTQSTHRLRWLLWIMLAWAVAIFGRLAWLQVIDHKELLREARKQQQQTVQVPAMRGAILDRTGQPLAKTLPAESITVDPLQVQDLDFAATVLASILELDRTKLYGQMRSAVARKKGFLIVARRVPAQQVKAVREAVRDLKLTGVNFEPDMQRLYPHGTLAAHVLGSVGYLGDDAVERGTAGVEMSFNEDLAGQPGEARQLTDAKENPYDSVIVREPQPGADLILTIDPNLQFQAETALDKAVASSHARTGSVIVLNPHNGDILAMANYPRYDPNSTPGKQEAPEARSNLAVTTPFEPGSVFKVFTLAAALETTRLTPDSMINCGNGVINLFGRIIHDHERYASLSMADVLAHSSNIGAIQIGREVGEKNLYSYATRFGFGKKTGIELPGESTGMLRRVSQWTPSSIGSVAMGHEVSATSLQLALAGAAVANGGLLLQPRLVMGRQRPGAAKEIFAPEKPQRIIEAETAIKMRQMMEGVVLHGTGKKAILKGYTSGGKTGSAQIYDLKAHVYTHSYNSSFLGFAPVVNPQIVIEVTLVGTTGGAAGYGGAVAAPVFNEVAMTALRILDVPKDLPGDSPEVSQKPSNENDLSIAGLGQPPTDLFSDFAHQTDVRSRSVSSVTSPPVSGGSPVSTGESSRDRRRFFEAPAASQIARSSAASIAERKTPDFRGMTLRTVLEESAAAGLEVEVSGNGLARAQDPPPGTALPARGLLHVQFSR